MSKTTGKSKRKRAHKVSKGLNKARKYPLDEVTKVLLGKGMFVSFKPLGHQR